MKLVLKNSGVELLGHTTPRSCRSPWAVHWAYPTAIHPAVLLLWKNSPHNQHSLKIHYWFQ